MRKPISAFTLVELLIVLAIIAVLAGVIFPVFARARRSARQAASISNLRQCGLALLMYCEDYGGYDAMPSWEVAAQVLKNAPTCDPSDTWRSNCAEKFGEPLIGSYGYVRAVKNYSTPEEWETYREAYKNPSILASVFYADNVSIPIHGDRVVYTARCGIDAEKCELPDHVLRFHLDGSVNLTAHTVALPTVSFPQGRLLFSWDTIFGTGSG